MSNHPLLAAAIAADPKEITIERGLVRQLLDMLEMPADSLHEGHEAVIAYVRTQIGDEQAKADLAFVHQYLHYNGACYSVLCADVRREALTLCDGFGRTEDPDLLYDWSHVRDSSPEALAECRAYIEGVVNFTD